MQRRGISTSLQTRHVLLLCALPLQVELPEQIEDKRGAFTPRGGFGPAGAFAGGFTPRAPSADPDASDGGADSPTQGLRRTAAGMKLKVPPRR